MLTECAKQQLKDCIRLGLRDQYGEEVIIENLEIKDSWESLILHEGTFSSLGLKRFYIKDPEIPKPTKYSIPYRGFMMPVMDRDVFIIQSISGDFVILRIIGERKDIKELKSMVRKDSLFELNGLDYEHFKEANRRDLELHKRISTYGAKYNKSPERLDAHGQVITSLDHFDNFEYIVMENDTAIYNIYNAESLKRKIENRLIYLEEKKFDYDYSIKSRDIEEAIKAIMSLYDEEIEKYFTKGGKFIYDNLEEICFQTELNKGQVWKAWKYMNWIEISKEIEELNKQIKKIELNMDIGTKSSFTTDDDIPYLFKHLSKAKIQRRRK